MKFVVVVLIGVAALVFFAMTTGARIAETHRQGMDSRLIERGVATRW
jgi:hypothetical protein